MITTHSTLVKMSDSWDVAILVVPLSLGAPTIFLTITSKVLKFFVSDNALTSVDLPANGEPSINPAGTLNRGVCKSLVGV